MGGEVGLFFGESFLDRDLIDNIFLSTVLDTDVSETKRHFLIHNHLLSVSTAIHNIYFGDHTNGTNTLLIDLTRHLKAI